MRRFLISVAVLALTAGTALAQPDNERRGPNNVGKASVAPEVQNRAQAESRGQAAPAPQPAAQGGGPTSFTNQIQGRQPDQQGRPQFDRGDRRGPQTAPAQQAVAPPQQLDQNRGNWQGRGDDRGDRGNGQGNRDQGNWQNRPDNRATYDNRRDINRDRDNNYRGGYNNYRGGYNGPRRDFRDYSNYHRDWRPTRRYRAPAYHRPPGWYSARWTFGQILPSLFWARDYWLDYRVYDLPQPPYGAVWVRVGNDALMIDDYSGEIITVSYNVFY